MRGKKNKEKAPAQNQVEDEGLTPCAETWCDNHHDKSPRNCLKDVGDFIICPDRTRPALEKPAEENRGSNPCRNDVCKHYDETFVLNCDNASSSKQKLVDICNFEVNANPEPVATSEEKHQQNIVSGNDRRRLKKLQINLEERDQKIIDWIDRQAHEHRQDRNGYIMNALENMMLRETEAA